MESLVAESPPPLQAVPTTANDVARAIAKKRMERSGLEKT
jgi:hypothetical protein